MEQENTFSPIKIRLSSFATPVDQINDDVHPNGSKHLYVASGDRISNHSSQKIASIGAALGHHEP